MRKIRSKNSSQNRKNRKSQNFQNFFLYLFLPQTNHFRYRNARSHRPVLETEGKLEKFVDTEESEPTKVAKMFYDFSRFFYFLLFPFLSLSTKTCKNLEIPDRLAARKEKRAPNFVNLPCKGKMFLLSCFLSLNRTLKKFNKIGKRPQFPSIRPRRFLRRPIWGRFRSALKW